MHRQMKIVCIVAITIIGLGGMVMLYQNNVSKSTTKTAPLHQQALTLHKSPTCECCDIWGTYMETEGYAVTTYETYELTNVKRSLHIPLSVESCHTAEIDSYVVEGHIPNIAIKKLLTERPDIAGIGMAGMPDGSPGMPGLKTNDFIIYEITHDGEQGEIFMTI